MTRHSYRPNGRGEREQHWEGRTCQNFAKAVDVFVETLVHQDQRECDGMAVDVDSEKYDF